MVDADASYLGYHEAAALAGAEEDGLDQGIIISAAVEAESIEDPGSLS